MRSQEDAYHREYNNSTRNALAFPRFSRRQWTRCVDALWIIILCTLHIRLALHLLQWTTCRRGTTCYENGPIVWMMIDPTNDKQSLFILVIRFKSGRLIAQTKYYFIWIRPLTRYESSSFVVPERIASMWRAVTCCLLILFFIQKESGETLFLQVTSMLLISSFEFRYHFLFWPNVTVVSAHNISKHYRNVR